MLVAISIILFILLVVVYVQAVRLANKVRELEQEKRGQKAINLTLAKMAVRDHLTSKDNANDVESLQQELNAKFPKLQRYFEVLFPVLKKEIEDKKSTFEYTARKKSVPQVAVLYAFLWTQITEQIKHGDNPTYILKDMYSLWNYLLGKLEYHHYFPAEDFPRMRAEMDEWAKQYDV